MTHRLLLSRAHDHALHLTFTCLTLVDGLEDASLADLLTGPALSIARHAGRAALARDDEARSEAQLALDAALECAAALHVAVALARFDAATRALIEERLLSVTRLLSLVASPAVASAA